MLDHTIPRASRMAAALLTATLGATWSPTLAYAEAPTSTTCPTSFAEPLARRTLPSIVTVAGPGGGALGFVVGSDRLVAVPLTVVEAGRGLVVQGVRGGPLRPKVVATDSEHDLALVEVPTPVPGARPLELGAGPLTLGTTVFSFSTLDLSKAADMVLPGVVSRVAGDTFNATSRMSFHASWGSPLLDCAGRVVGLAATPGGDDVLSASVLPALLARATREPEYSSGWSFAHPSVGLPSAWGRDGAWIGASFGTSLVGDNRFELSLRGELYGLLEPATKPAPSLASDSGLRIDADVRVAYRVLLNEGFPSVYWVPSLGAVAGWERWWHDESNEQVIDSSCSPAEPCPVEEVGTTRRSDRLRVAPVLGTALRLTAIEIGYSLELDVQQPAASTHTLLLGVQL